MKVQILKLNGAGKTMLQTPIEVVDGMVVLGHGLTRSSLEKLMMPMLIDEIEIEDIDLGDDHGTSP